MDALEALVEQAKECVGAMQSLVCRPRPHVGAPRLAGRYPLVATAMQPACFFVRLEALEAPVCSRLVEVLPGPLDHDQRSSAGKGGPDAVEDLGGIGDVM
jgi:hypothetical protein